jgi:hypothetical protein
MRCQRGVWFRRGEERGVSEAKRTHTDSIVAYDRLEPVRDTEESLLLEVLPDRLLDLRIRFEIDRCSGLNQESEL